MGSHLISLTSSSRSLLVKSLRTSSSSSSPYMPNQFRRCFGSSHSHEEQEIIRAPSTAQVFERVAEEKEKLKEADQGIASQTIDKTYDSTLEATLGDGAKVDSLDERYKKNKPGADDRRRPHDDD